MSKLPKVINSPFVDNGLADLVVSNTKLHGILYTEYIYVCRHSQTRFFTTESGDESFTNYYKSKNDSNRNHKKNQKNK